MRTAPALAPNAVAARERDLGVDALRLVMAAFVVGIHKPPFAEVSPDLTAALVNGLFRLAVPVFFVLNGWFLDLGDRAACLRFARRVLVLYLVWTAIYTPLWLIDTDGWLLGILRTLATGYMQLWYLAALPVAVAIGHLAVALPVRWRLALAGGLFLLGWALQVSVLRHPEAALGNEEYRNALLFGFPFLIVGHWLRRSRWAKLGRGAALQIAVAALALLAAEVAAMERLTGNAGQDILLSLLVAAPALVLVASRLGLRTNSAFLADASLVTYLTHLAVFAVLRLPPTAEMLATIVVCIAITPLLRIANQRFPLL